MTESRARSGHGRMYHKSHSSVSVNVEHVYSPVTLVDRHPTWTVFTPPQTDPPEVSRRSALIIVARTAGPHLVEATLIPAVLFYLFLVTAGLTAAYLAALGWSYGAIAYRRLRGQPIPPLLMLGAGGLTIRTIVALFTDSSFIYFFQPVLGTVTMGFVFLVSVALGRPMVGKLASEFWPLTPDVTSRPAIVELFRRLTLLWAGVHLVTAAVTLTLLTHLPLAVFLATKQLSGLAITMTGIAITISASLATAKREGLASTNPLLAVPVAADAQPWRSR